MQNMTISHLICHIARLLMTYDLFGLVQKFSIHKIEAEFVVVVFLFYFFIVFLVLLLLFFFQDNGTVASENEDKHT